MKNPCTRATALTTAVKAAAMRVKTDAHPAGKTLTPDLMGVEHLSTIILHPHQLPATNKLRTAETRSLREPRNRRNQRTRRNTTVLLLKDKGSSNPPTKVRGILHSSNEAVDEAVDVEVVVTTEATLEASAEDIQVVTMEVTTMVSLAPIPMFMIPMRAPHAW